MPDINSLLRQLTSGEDTLAEAAVSEIAELQAAAIPPLVALLESQVPDHRWWAVRTLAEIHDPQVPHHLHTALKDPDPSVKQCAALALSKQPTPGAIPDLVKALDSDDRMLARLAADALIAAGEDAVPALIEVLESGEHIARLQAARALAEIGDERAIGPLFKAWDTDSAILQYWAEIGLDRMGVGMTFFDPE